jgi:uncharacterized protein (TIGR03382 family)
MRTRSFQAQTAATLAALALAGCVSPDGGTLLSEDRAVTAQRALSAFSRIDRVARAGDGLPYFVRGNLGKVTGGIADVAQAESALASALPSIAASFAIDAADLTAAKVQRDKFGGTHVHFAQSKNGLPVVNGELIVHLGADGAIRSVSSSARDGVALTATPSVLSSRAAEIARAATASGAVTTSEPALKYLLANSTGELHLAWEIEATGTETLLNDRVYVDALTGVIVDRHPQVFTARNRIIKDATNQRTGQPGVYPLGILFARQIGTETSPPTADEIAMAAYENTGATYDCYDELFERDSYDGAGAQLQSVMHIVFPVGDGTNSPNNAAWAGTTMVYGDGDGEFFAPTALGFDVTAHELTHGVTSATAKLVYQNESGALNEAMSDIMAAVCEVHRDGEISADTWLVGEDIFTPARPGDGLRYMNDPTADSALYPKELGGSRDFYPDRYTGQEDAGGVHLNSGIANLAFQLLVDGGTHPQAKTTFRVPGIGIESAGAIFQHALTQGFFTANTNFAQARTLTEEVAEELYGAREVAAVGFAWAAVGVGEPPADVDTTPPTVSITSPDDGDEVEAGFTVTVTATDDDAVTKVELKVDGTVVGTDTTAPYSFETADDLAVGEHTIEAIAYDSLNTASDEITVTIAAPGGDDPGGDDPGGDDPGGDDPGGDNPGDDDGGGGCNAGAGGAASGSLLMMVGLALSLRRRR